MTPTLRRISAGAQLAPWSRRAAAAILSIALAALVQAEGGPPAGDTAGGAPAQAAQGPTLQAQLDRTEAAVRAAEALRDVKRVQHAYAQYLEFALWNDLADLFAENGVATYGTETVSGREKIRAYYIDTLGKGKVGLENGQYMPHLAMSPVITFDPDGRTIRGRWRVMTLLARHGVSGSWEGGIYENEFVRENGAWKIGRLHYYPAWSGKYEDPGWSETPEGAPYHYDPKRAGTPVPDSALAALAPAATASGANASTRVTDLERRVARLDDEDDVVRLQNAYGYYVDKKLWDDAADLFAADATMEIDQRGVYAGQPRIRKGLETAGPSGVKTGELHDHVQLQPVVTVAADGTRAWVRGSELRMTGINGSGAEFGQGIFENEYVQSGGAWKIAAMRVYGRMRTDYDKGPQSALPLEGPSTTMPPDRPPTQVYQAHPAVFYPSFHYPHPVTGRPTAIPGGRAWEKPRAAGPNGAARTAGAAQPVETRLAAVERGLEVVIGRVGAENVADAYGYYIDDFKWDNTADLFSVDGWKELSYIGAYVGRERVRASMKMRYADGRKRGGNFQAHQKTQPVISIARDGRSGRIRLRLVQLGGSAKQGAWIGGIYENGVVKEDGVWKISAMDLDYVYSANYKGGWAARGRHRGHAVRARARFGPHPTRSAAARVVFAPFPERVETGFHYKNPVSGRMPPVLLP